MVVMVGIQAPTIVEAAEALALQELMEMEHHPVGNGGDGKASSITGSSVTRGGGAGAISSSGRSEDLAVEIRVDSWK